MTISDITVWVACGEEGAERGGEKCEKENAQIESKQHNAPIGRELMEILPRVLVGELQCELLIRKAFSVLIPL